MQIENPETLEFLTERERERERERMNDWRRISKLLNSTSEDDRSTAQFALHFFLTEADVTVMHHLFFCESVESISSSPVPLSSFLFPLSC